MVIIIFLTGWSHGHIEQLCCNYNKGTTTALSAMEEIGVRCGRGYYNVRLCLRYFGVALNSHVLALQIPRSLGFSFANVTHLSLDEREKKKRVSKERGCTVPDPGYSVRST